MSKLTFRMFERVPTADPRMHIRQAGYVRQRADHPQGDSVNVLAFGGRFDDLAEFLDRRRDKSDSTAVTTQNLQVMDAQAVHDVPVTEAVVAKA